MEKREELKVIGWTSYDDDDFVGNESGILGYGGTAEEDEVIAADIREHGYFFTGDDHQEDNNCAPVLSDYRVIRFSTRHFGAVMAAALGEDPRKAYSIYAWNFGFENAEKVRPTGELTVLRTKMPPTRFEIGEKTFSLIRSNKCVYDDEGSDEEYFEGLELDFELYLVPIKRKEGEYYWLGDEVTLVFGNKTVSAVVGKILAYRDYAAFASDVENRNSGGLYRYVFDEEELKASVGDEPFVVLAVRAEAIFGK